VLKTSPIKKAPPGIEKQLESLLPPANQKNKQLTSRQVATAQTPKTIQQPIPKIVKKPLPKAKPPIVKQVAPVVAKIQKLPSSVTSQQQSISKPASKPQKVLNSDLTGLWIVQAGVFKEKANADALRTKLSKNGFSAYLESVTTELGELIRVRAGRVPEEKAARQMVMALNKRFALKSITFPETKWNSKRARQ
jgi:cell division septation protein DedD